MIFLLPTTFRTPQTFELQKKKIKDFAETYFRGSTESKLFTESYFRRNGQNPRNPGKFSSLM